MSKDKEQYRPAGTATERKLLAIWKDILSQTEIDVDDNFLDLGGDSLSAMLCVSRVRNAFGVELFLEEFFMDDATVAQLSRIIDEKTASALPEA